jgi:hypothetical protein
MSLMAQFVSGRWSKFAGLVIWIALTAVLAPSTGRFESAQRNEPPSVLPREPSQ